MIQRATSASGPWTTVDDGVSTARRFTATGLINGTRYFFRVAARNAAGTGPFSAAVAATPRTVPCGTAALIGDAVVASGPLAWSAPASNGGAAITDYVIQRSRSRSGPWTTVNDGVSTARRVHRHRPQQRHPLLLPRRRPQRRRHRLVLGRRHGDAADRAIGTAGAEGGTVVASSSTDVESAGIERRRGDHRLRHPTVAASRSGPWTTVNDGVSTARQFTVTGLTNGTRYFFRVAARNPAGLGSWSAIKRATPER